MVGLQSCSRVNQAKARPIDDPLDVLVRELLLVRTDDLSGPQLAAFVDGWSSLLGLLGRTDLVLPEAPAEVADAVARVVERVRAAQARVLGDDDE